MYSQHSLKVRAIAVETLRPDDADSEIIEHITELPPSSPQHLLYIVKFYLDRTDHFARSLGFELYIGSEHVSKHVTIQGGIGFKIFSLKDLAKLSGGLIQFESDENHKLTTGVRFPDFAGKVRLLPNTTKLVHY